jgi:hypothetical protein
MTTFNEALAAHGSAEEAIRHTLKDVYKYAHGNMTESFGPVAQWVLDNAPAIHAHQSGKNERGAQIVLQRVAIFEQDMEDSLAQLAARIQALEDAPGPRPNDAEVSALRWRIDYLVETLAKMRSLDTSDVLTALVRDVALLKDENILANTTSVDESVWRKFRDTAFGTEPQTPEARKLLGLGAQPVATPEPEPVYEWHGNSYRLAGNTKGMLCYGLDSVIGVAGQSCKVFDTEAAARSWVEAQIKTPKP